LSLLCCVYTHDGGSVCGHSKVRLTMIKAWCGGGSLVLVLVPPSLSIKPRDAGFPRWNRLLCMYCRTTNVKLPYLGTSNRHRPCFRFLPLILPLTRQAEFLHQKIAKLSPSISRIISRGRRCHHARLMQRVKVACFGVCRARSIDCCRDIADMD